MQKGRHTYPDGSHYEGEFKNGKRHGRGMLLRPDGVRYEGEWQNDKPHGRGIATAPDGRKRIGKWHEGKFIAEAQPDIDQDQRIQVLENENRRLKQGISTLTKKLGEFEREQAASEQFSMSGEPGFSSTAVRQLPEKQSDEKPVWDKWQADIIVLKNVSKTYRTGQVETRALKDVSLAIGKGEFIVILGPSGSGKSTLLNVISGLDRPTSGSIKFSGSELTTYTEEQLTRFRRKHLGFVFQQYNLLQNLTALDNVRMGADISDDPLEPVEVLSKVGLLKHMHKYPYQLSGGEQQRVSVARSVVKNPAILFCDEPTGSLDEKIAKYVLAIIEELNREMGVTIVMITHNRGIGQMADRVVKMNSGIIENVIMNRQKIRAGQVRWG